MAIGVYSRKVLTDNWCEDRNHEGDMLSATGNYSKRAARGYETDLAYIGERYDVLSRISRMPKRQSWALPDDGFNEKSTTQGKDYGHPSAHPMFASKRASASAPCLITTNNAPVGPVEKRPLKGTNSGFGATISRHAVDHEASFFSTTHGDFYGHGVRAKPLKRDPSGHEASGVSSEYEGNKSSGMMCGQLCGENFVVHTDPGRDTRTQRSWMPGLDPAIKNIHHGGAPKALPKEDNHMSLPLGEGVMSKIRADLKERNGRMYRNGTTITKGAHMRSGVSVFQDH